MSKQAFTVLSVLFFVLLFYASFALAGPGTPPIPMPPITYDRLDPGPDLPPIPMPPMPYDRASDGAIGNLKGKVLWVEPVVSPSMKAPAVECKKPPDLREHQNRFWLIYCGAQHLLDERSVREPSVRKPSAFCANIVEQVREKVREKDPALSARIRCATPADKYVNWGDDDIGRHRHLVGVGDLF